MASTMISGSKEPSISSSIKRSSRCYFCYLAQKHTCTLAFVAILVAVHYSVNIIKTFILMSKGVDDNNLVSN